MKWQSSSRIFNYTITKNSTDFNYYKYNVFILMYIILPAIFTYTDLHIHIYTHIYIYTHNIYIHIYIYIYIYTHIYTYIHTHIYMHTSIHITT